MQSVRIIYNDPQSSLYMLFAKRYQLVMPHCSHGLGSNCATVLQIWQTLQLPLERRTRNQNLPTL